MTGFNLLCPQIHD